MNRSGIVLAIGGIVLGIVALVLSQRARSELSEQQAAPRAKDPAVERLEGKVDALAQEVKALRAERSDTGERVAALEQELGGARRTLGELAAALEEVRKTGGTAGGATVEPPHAGADAVDAGKAEFAALRKKIFAGEGTADDQQRFWELARTTGALAELIQELAAQVEAAPSDASARMQLAQAYLAKLLTVPEGPERGSWAMKAEGQWSKVLEMDADHWEARYSRAFSWSQWPDFLNKTPDAIREFEDLRGRQARLAVEPDHAQTYLQLALLYRKVGNHEKARAVLEEGLARHPRQESLQKALDSSGR